MASPTELPADQLNEAVEKQMEGISKDIAQEQVLISKKEPVAVIEKDYCSGDATGVFLKRAKEIASKFKFIRKIRPDGNCFYRALVMAQLEYMLSNKKEAERFAKVAAGWKDRLIKLGFPQFTTEDFCDTFMEEVNGVLEGKTTEAELEEKLNDEGISNYLVVFMRLVSSGYLQENEEFYKNFIDEAQTVKAYCSAFIEPMYKDTDHLMISAVTNGLAIPIRIEYIDRQDKAAKEGEHHHDFIPDGCSPDSVYLNFLYRHDHYEILYF